MHFVEKPAEAHINQGQIIEPQIIEPEVIKPEVIKPEVIKPEVIKPVYCPEQYEIVIQTWAPLFVDTDKLTEAEKRARGEKKAAIIASTGVLVLVLILVLVAVLCDRERWHSTNSLPEVVADPSGDSSMHLPPDYEGHKRQPRDMEGLENIDSLPPLAQCETDDGCEPEDYCFEGFCFERIEEQAGQEPEEVGSGDNGGKKKKRPKKPKAPKKPKTPVPAFPRPKVVSFHLSRAIRIPTVAP
ncbi:hypothetical protein N7470_009590 [Penicillium chermesinum]|nr:hypothetical protein N7470_009590 [Penicillium chermesinum]